MSSGLCSPLVPLFPYLPLQVEEQALSKEKDTLSRTRVQEVRRELAALEEALAPLQMRYWQEKERVQAMRRWGEGDNVEWGRADSLRSNGEGVTSAVITVQPG